MASAITTKLIRENEKILRMESIGEIQSTFKYIKRRICILAKNKI